MKKQDRIKKNEDFQAIFKRGTSMANRQFVIYALDKPGQENFRLGLSVSKKIGNAVTRNRVKRLIRQFFIENRERLSAGKDYIVIARKPAAEMDYHDVIGSLTHVSKKAGIWKRSAGK